MSVQDRRRCGKRLVPSHTATSVPPPPPPTDPLLVGAIVAAAVLVVAVLYVLVKRTRAKTAKTDDPNIPVCSLVFSDKDESMTAVFHLQTAAPNRTDERLLATFTPTVPVSAYKLQHNLGRTELVRSVSQKKSAHIGWVQYLTLAKRNRAPVRFLANVPGRDVLLASINGDSIVRRCLAGDAPFDLDDVLSVAVAPAAHASIEFNVKYFEKAQFEVLGGRLGATESFDEGRSPGSRPSKEKGGVAVARSPTRKDMMVVGRSSKENSGKWQIEATPTAENVM